MAFSTMLDSPPFLLPGVVLALRFTLPRCQVGVVPGHLIDQGLRHLGRGRTCGELVDAVTHFGGFREHHAGAGAHQQVGAKAHGRVGGDARERIAAPALHAHHQFASRHGFAAARVQALQVRLSLPQDGLHHRHEAHMGFVLQAHHIQPLGAAAFVHHGDGAGGQQSLGLQLFAAQARHVLWSLLAGVGSAQSEICR